MEKIVNGRIVHKHDIEANWIKAKNLIPKQGELIIYDVEVDKDGNPLELPENRTTPYTYERFKIGDGIHNVNDLPFMDESIILPSTQVTHRESLLSDILETYILSIDYSALAFDTTEIVVNATNTTSVLGQAILGQLVLA